MPKGSLIFFQLDVYTDSRVTATPCFIRAAQMSPLCHLRSNGPGTSPQPSLPPRNSSVQGDGGLLLPLKHTENSTGWSGRCRDAWETPHLDGGMNGCAGCGGSHKPNTRACGDGDACG